MRPSLGSMIGCRSSVGMSAFLNRPPTRRSPCWSTNGFKFLILEFLFKFSFFCSSVSSSSKYSLCVFFNRKFLARVFNSNVDFSIPLTIFAFLISNDIAFRQLNHVENLSKRFILKFERVILVLRVVICLASGSSLSVAQCAFPTC